MFIVVVASKQLFEIELLHSFIVRFMVGGVVSGVGVVVAVGVGCGFWGEGFPPPPP